MAASVFHPDGHRRPPRPDIAAEKPGSRSHPNTDTQKCSGERKKRKREKRAMEGRRGGENLDPCCGLCVGTGEQFVLQNSHYQHSAAGLQLAGAEGSVAWPNEGLILPPFFVKMQIRAAPPTANSLPASALLLQMILPITKKTKHPHNLGQIYPENEAARPTPVSSRWSRLVQAEPPINQIMLKDKKKNSSNTTNQEKATMHREWLR